jgi:hypothetical protein
MDRVDAMRTRDQERPYVHAKSGEVINMSKQFFSVHSQYVVFRDKLLNKQGFRLERIHVKENN